MTAYNAKLPKRSALGLRSIQVQLSTPPVPRDPSTCANCRFAKEHAFSAGVETEEPAEEHYTCSRGHPTCDANANPSLFSCTTWQRRQTAAQDIDDLFHL